MECNQVNVIFVQQDTLASIRVLNLCHVLKGTLVPMGLLSVCYVQLVSFPSRMLLPLVLLVHLVVCVLFPQIFLNVVHLEPTVLCRLLHACHVRLAFSVLTLVYHLWSACLVHMLVTKVLSALNVQKALFVLWKD